MYPLFDVLQTLRPAFTEPTFFRSVVLFAGWVGTTGLHAVTQSLVQSGVAGLRHHAAYHRFFARARWSPDELGRLLLLRLIALQPGRLRLVLDDTLCTHKGPKVFGLGCHLDPVRSTRRVRLFTFGHVWVTLAVLVKVPLASRPWAVPIAFRLYRTESANLEAGLPHRKKTQLARELLDVVAGWLPEVASFEVAADLAYSNDTVLRGLDSRFVFTGMMRDDAVLSRPRERKTYSRTTGRPLTKDLPVPSPRALAANAAVPWTRVATTIWGRDRVFLVKHLTARWYRAAKTTTLSIVILKVTTGQIPYRVFFCTDASRSAREVIETYYDRWAIEVLFRDLKQLLGFAASRARTQPAVLRTTPWVGLNYTVLVLWYLKLGARLPTPIRPWYRKQGICFADVLRHAQRQLGAISWSDPRRALDDLRRQRAQPRSSALAG